MRYILSALAAMMLFCLMPSLAAADPVAAQSVTANNFYASCGNTNYLSALQPDVAPPAAPEMMCTDYTGGQATLTVRLKDHDSGGFVASAYIDTDSHPVWLQTIVNAGQVDASGASIAVAGPAIVVPTNTTGWTTLPTIDVRVFDTVDVVIHSSWTGAGSTRVGMVHGEIYPSELGLPGTWARTPIPDNVAYDDTVDPRWPGRTIGEQAALDVQNYAKADGSNTWINRTSYTPNFFVVPANQPLRPVLGCRSNSTGTGDAAADTLHSTWKPSANDQVTLGSPSGGSGLVAGHPYRVININAAAGTFQLQAMGTTGPVDFTTDLTSVNLCIQQSWFVGLARMLSGLKMDGLTDLHGGVAVPDGVISGAPGTDGEIVIRQPRWVSPAYPTHVGRVWELWQLKPNPDFDPNQPESGYNAKFKTSSGGRWAPMSISQFNSANRWFQGGIYAPTEPGNPNSEREETGWKVTGGGLQLVNDVVSDADLRLGEIRHAIGLETPYSRYAVRWPGTTSDGWVASNALTEGMRLRILPTQVKPAGMTRLENMIWDAGVKYGFVVDDQTASAVVVRVQLNSPTAQALMDGQSSSKQIDQLQFKDMKVLK